MYRRAIAFATVSFCNLLAACSADDATPEVTVNCNEPTDLVVNCNSGNDNDTGDIIVGSPPATGASEKFPDLCITYPEYTSVDKSCKSELDCDIPTSPCEERQCLNGICSAIWPEKGANACGDSRLSCHHSSCCGTVEDGPIECENPGQCPTPIEGAPNCRKRLCWEGRCLNYAYIADTCEAFD